jgi:type II secretory pathway pseudopilin PulG
MRVPQKIQSKQRHGGFLLLEVVLALGIFTSAAIGFALALQKAADASNLIEREMQITRVLQSSLYEALATPQLEEGKNTQSLKEREMEIDTEIEKLEKIENQDGKLLQDMWLIKVTANWLENGKNKQRSVETWRYGKLYQP